MRLKKSFFIILLVFVIFFLNSVSATYTSSEVQWSQYTPSSTQTFDQSVCQAGQDFLIQIAPFGCTPAVVRTDLLEENDVPIYCQLGATQINPLIDVKAVDSISFSGQYPQGVAGVGFYPAKAAIGVEGNLNNPVLNNIGYVVILLKKQANASAMPDSISGNLTAKIKYNINNAFGIGKALFHLQEISDNNDWDSKKYQYSFWNGKGYIRAESIDDDRAYVSVYQNDQKISSLTLKKGETSNSIYLPGFDCQAGLKLKLEDLENPNTRARLRVNAEVVEVAKGEKFLDNKCEVADLKKNGIVQTVSLKCQEDEAIHTFDIIINPSIILNINGQEREASVGDYLYDQGEMSVYLGYVGVNGDSKLTKDLFVYLVSMPQRKDKLDDKDISSINSLVGDFLGKKELQSTGIIDRLDEAVKAYAGLFNLFSRAVVGQTFYRLNFEDKNQEAYGQKISIVNFAGAQDIELVDSVKEYYENAKKDYETIRKSFSSEEVSGSSSTFGEEALYNEIILAFDAGQKLTAMELCKNFEEDYPNSVIEECNNALKLSNKKSAEAYVTINGENKKISFDGIYEPSFEEYGARVLVNSPDSSGSFDLRKNVAVDLLESGSDSMELISVDETSAQLSITTESKTEIVKLDKASTKNKGNYSFTLADINLKKLAKVSVIPNIDNTGTEANFSFKIGIEKRAIDLPPEKVKSLIKGLDEEIKQWGDISDSLGGLVEGLKTSCLVTGAALIAKNFLLNTGTSGIARQKVMRSSGGWYEKCTNLVSQGEYKSQEECYTKNSDQIDSDVNTLSKLMDEQNSQIKKLEEGITTQEFLGSDTVDTEKFAAKYSPQVSNYLNSNFGNSFTDPSGRGETINKSEILTILSSDYKEGKYTTDQLRNIELYAGTINDPSASQELKDIANTGLYSELLNIKIASKNSAQISNWANSIGVPSQDISSLETGKNTKKLSYEGLTNGKIGNKIAGESSDAPVVLIQTFPDGQQYILVLDNSAGTSQMPIKSLSNNQLAIYTSSGQLAENPPNELRNVYFQKYDSSTYQNQYKNAKLRYYETDPYKGLPAIVPFDLKNGWYAATKQTLATGSNIQTYDASGRISSFYLCNVGQNGLEEFQSVGDDICEMINTGTGQAYNQFPGLSEDEAKQLITTAVKSIEQASKLYKSGLSGSVNVNGQKIDIGSPATNIPDYQCQDFMSPKECLLLFNLCDPVICPSSRCDLGGAYPVSDVVQSGVIGSLVLCLPNIEEGIIIPVCLTGIKAGIDGFLSVKTAYRDCLQESLDTGKMVGICDEIYSIYLCDFFWKQTLPLANIVIPKMFEILLGQNVRGGGEYMGVASAWQGAGSAVDYFVNYYGANSKAAFLARSTEGVGEEVCKVYASSVVPSGGDILNELTKPDSPVQFTGRFDESTLTTATAPPTSHYKVYYHIYAGEDSGAYYKVYLKGNSESSYYQDVSQNYIVASGYVSLGGYADETKDFIATSGYKELCINVNGQEECGFKEVSTSFAVNYIKDQYIASQVTETDIKTESACVSGTSSIYSLLNPNAQSATEEVINPEIYNQGITRICATDDPGKGTDPYAGTENARWKEVGYCDNEKIKCWLDTQTVENVIKTTTVEDQALQEVSQDYVNILSNREGYLTEDQFASAVQEINDEQNFGDKISLVDQVFDKVFWSSEKAQLLYLRGNAYATLFRIVFSGLPKPTSTITETTTISANTTLTSETGPSSEVSVSTSTDARQRVLDTLKVLDGSSADKVLIKNYLGLSKPANDVHCWDSIMYVYKKAGVQIGGCMYSDNIGQHYTINGDKITLGVDKRDGGIIFQVYPRYCKLSAVSEQQKFDNIQPGDVLSIVSDQQYGHNVVFVKWIDESKRIAQLFGWRRDNQNKLVYGYYQESIGKNGNHPVYVYWVPSVSGTIISVPLDNVKPLENDESGGAKIYKTARDFVSSGSTENSIKFVLYSLISDATGISIDQSKIASLIIYPSVHSLAAILDANKDFVKIDVTSSNLKTGDIILFGQECNIYYSIGIFSNIVNNKIYFYSNFGKAVELKSIPLDTGLKNSLYVYRAYRYVGDLSTSQKSSIQVRSPWTVNTALDKIVGLRGSYDDNKVFVDELIFDGILTENECKEIRGVNTVISNLGGAFLQKDMNWLKNKLLEKQLTSGQVEEKGGN